MYLLLLVIQLCLLVVGIRVRRNHTSSSKKKSSIKAAKQKIIDEYIHDTIRNGEFDNDSRGYNSSTFDRYGI